MWRKRRGFSYLHANQQPVERWLKLHMFFERNFLESIEIHSDVLDKSIPLEVRLAVHNLLYKSCIYYTMCSFIMAASVD